MTTKEDPSRQEETVRNLEEICENTRAIRRVVNRIFDHLHEYAEQTDEYDPDTVDWRDLYENDDMYH